MRLRHLAVAIAATAVVAAIAATWLIDDSDARSLAYLVLVVGAALGIGLLVIWGEQRALRSRLPRDRRPPNPDVANPDLPGPDLANRDVANRDVAEALSAIGRRLEALADRVPDGTSPLVTRTELHTRTSWLHRRIAETVAVGTRQTDALINLHAFTTPRIPLVPSDGWAAEADLLALLVHLVAVHRPRLVVELGSGTSTLWLGYTVERYGGHVVSLDHDPRFAEATRLQVAHHDLASTVQVRHAPLVDTTAGGWQGRYYDLTVLGDATAIDLLVVDGPPGDLQPRSREPAVTLLCDRLSPDARIVLDDAARDDESQTVAAWTERDDIELERRFSHFASAPALLRRTRR